VTETNPDAGYGQVGAPEPGDPGQGPTVRDRRRIDPTTGAVRPDAAGPARPDATGGAHAGAPADATATGGLQEQVVELTGDLQRVQAEYANYRRRMDRERVTLGETAVGNALTELFPVLDDIGRARDHGELVGGFKSVADRLDAALSKLGLVAFGAPGDPFDPMRHEALVHSYSDEVTDTTCTEVFAPGYQLGDRILRAAKVAVADPAEPLPAASDGDVAAMSDEEPGADDAPREA
jgi:molecular chaperone GrpE